MQSTIAPDVYPRPTGGHGGVASTAAATGVEELRDMGKLSSAVWEQGLCVVTWRLTRAPMKVTSVWAADHRIQGGETGAVGRDLVHMELPVGPSEELLRPFVDGAEERDRIGCVHEDRQACLGNSFPI